MADFAVIIPARYASTRYPGKPLVPLRGATGVQKTLIQRSWECASAIPGCGAVFVATDDDRIATEVRRFGGQVVMTSPECANGTERCADAIQQLGNIAEIVVNLQGDAPLSPTFVPQELVARLHEDPEVVMSTPATRCSRSLLEHLMSDAAEGRVGGTTTVFSETSRALYFSKRILPYVSDGILDAEILPVYLHLGIYAYRASALAQYKSAGPSQLETLEGLEQLRFLELGLPVSIVELEPLDWDAVELNNPSDVQVIERVLVERGID